MKKVGKIFLPRIKKIPHININKNAIFRLLKPTFSKFTKSFSPNFLPIITVDATLNPTHRLKVKLAIESAIWCEAMSLAEINPQIKAAPAKAVTSKNNCRAVGKPNLINFSKISLLKRLSFRLNSLMYLLVRSSFTKT